MKTTRRRPNPFYVILVLASTAFVVTAMAYYVSPMVAQRAAESAEKGGPMAQSPSGPVAWFDRWGTLLLGAEFAVMLASGLLAMATDRGPTSAPKPPSAG